jgi:UDP-glucose 4-epimerase
MTVLVTGGAGYIGSHVLVELIHAGYDVVVVDNLSNGWQKTLDGVEQITGQNIVFFKGDVRDKAFLYSVFSDCSIDAVLHLAGLKVAGESIEDPLHYFDNNVTGSLVLFEVMKAFGCKTLVFSSSAAVYGTPSSVPVDESCPLCPVNPYGQTKHVVEMILRDLYESDDGWAVGVLRYFNPLGAHESGLIGEVPSLVPSNLMPLLLQVASGEQDVLSVHGGDYDTPDGTGVRDFIHVVDLAKGHVQALGRVLKKSDFFAVNLGTGRGYSVLELVGMFEKVSGCRVPFEIVGRRPGDVASSFACPDKAQSILDWRATLDLEKMCADVWHWHNHPEGCFSFNALFES